MSGFSPGLRAELPCPGSVPGSATAGGRSAQTLANATDWGFYPLSLDARWGSSPHAGAAAAAAASRRGRGGVPAQAAPVPLPENHLGEDRLLQPAEAERRQSAPPAAVGDLVLRQQTQEGDRLQVVAARAPGDPAGSGRGSRLCTDSELNPLLARVSSFSPPGLTRGAWAISTAPASHFKIHSGVRA